MAAAANRPAFATNSKGRLSRTFSRREESIGISVIGDDQGDPDRTGEGDGDVAEELARLLLDEEDRDEHREGRQGRGENRPPDLLRAVVGRRNGVLPICWWRKMFSSTTIALSTTMPTAKASPARETMFSDLPKA